MKRLLISALAAASLAAAVTPALAAPFGTGFHPGPSPAYGADINGQEANIAQRINQGERGGGLTRREAWQLRAQLQQIQDLEARYRHNHGGYNRGPGGLSNFERADLQRRLDALSARVFTNRHDADQRYH